MTGPDPTAGQSAGASRLPVTLGLLAGGQGRRLGGVDKAWLVRDGQPQVERLASMFPGVSAVLVSSNAVNGRYAASGLRVVADATPGLGPVAGLAALAGACRTPWLLSVPVDTLDPPPGLAAWLLAEARRGAPPAGVVVRDDDGLQPLVALWRVDALLDGAAHALAARRLAVRELVHAMGVRTLILPGVRLGNLNTPDDLRAAGMGLPEGDNR